MALKTPNSNEPASQDEAANSVPARANPAGEQSLRSPSTSPPSVANWGTQLRNLVIVAVATVLTVAVVLGFQTQTPSASLGELAEAAVPLETALANGQPTLMEFYANWCTSCQAMAPDMAELRSRFGDQINFVMLNVDNSKWLPEMLHYRVDGIPHFVYLDGDGASVASVIGEQPKVVIAANIAALIDQSPLPYAQVIGQTSDIEAPLNPTRSDDPRGHSAQVVN
ncbi:MAG: thioredoxin family protein [Cyanobacteria bacterium P01_C01_bin.73]